MALLGIMDDPRLDLVGVYAYSEEKLGLDAGEICGRQNCGVMATNDIDALIALGADIVIYTPYLADLSHVVKLLENGLDVISTNLLSNVGGIEGKVKEQLEAACARGGSSLYITGINPGWIDSVGATLTTVCRRIESISIMESVSVSHYESADTWRGVGLSLAETTPEVIQSARSWLTSFRDSVVRIAETLEYKLDDIEFFVEYGTASHDLDLGWFLIKKDTHAAIRAGWNGKIDGRTVVQVRVLWYMTKDLNEGWEIGNDNYYVDIEGEANVNARIRVTPPKHWSNLEHASATAMPAVNSAFQVNAARPGILGLGDVRLPHAPAGLWGRPGS